MQVVVKRKGGASKLKIPKDASYVEVGFPAGAVKSDIIERAVYNEFGTSRIPERPFMRNAMAQNKRKYAEAIKTSAKKILLGQTTLQIVLSKLGIVAQTDIKEEISTLMDPPNAPSTIKAKGSSKPLIDTGEMRDAVTWRVVRK